MERSSQGSGLDSLALLLPADEEETISTVGRLEEDAEDAATLDAHPANAPSCWLVFDYHVVYSPSYGVPVLFFNVMRAGEESGAVVTRTHTTHTHTHTHARAR